MFSKLRTKLTFLLVLALLFTGCDKKKEEEKKEKTRFEDVVEKEKKKTPRIEKIFLGYEFGMTKRQFERYTYKLYKKKKLKKDALGYYYKYKGDVLSNSKGYLRPSFFHNKLWELKIVFKSDGDLFLPITLFMELEKLIEKKYPVDYYNTYYNYDEKYDTIEKIYVNHNLQIRLFGDNKLGFLTLTYTDLPTEDKVKEEEERKKAKEKEELKKDL